MPVGTFFGNKETWTSPLISHEYKCLSALNWIERGQEWKREEEK